MRQYHIIYADPPWDYSSNIRKKEYGDKRNIKEQYDTMSIKDICKSPPFNDL
jgi:hypothetical protein